MGDQRLPVRQQMDQPPGPDWDLCRGEARERPSAIENIANVPLPTTDPVAGIQGPVIKYWLNKDEKHFTI